MKVFLLMTLLATVAHADALAPTDEVAAFERDHRRSEQQELYVLDVVAAEGALSLAGGIGLTVPSSYDGGLRAAGGVNLGFGFVNVALSAAVIPLMLHVAKVFDRQHDERTTVRGLADARRQDARFARRQSTLFGVLLGLDGGLALVGVASIIASQHGVDHPDRWLGAGIALCAQNVFDAAVDLTSLLIWNHRQITILDSLVPVAAITPTARTVGIGGRF